MGGTVIWSPKAKRFYVQVYWAEKKWRFWKWNGEYLWGRPVADKLLNRIRSEIDDGTFVPESFLKDSPLSIEEYSKQWLEACGGCENTKRFYRTNINRVINKFGKNFDIRKFTHSALQIFYNKLPLSVKGKYNVLSTLRTMLNFYKKDYPKFVMPIFPPLPLGEPEDTPNLTFEEQQAQLEAIENERDRLPVAWGMEFGLRVGEVRATMKDVVTDVQWTVKRAFSQNTLRATKDKRWRTYLLTSRARQILEKATQYNRFSLFVFVKENGEPYTLRDLDGIWNKACAKTGITVGLQNALRHSLGCQLVDEGHSLDLVQDTLGHTTQKTTRRYAKRPKQQVAIALQQRGQVIRFTDHLLTVSGDVTTRNH